MGYGDACSPSGVPCASGRDFSARMKSRSGARRASNNGFARFCSTVSLAVFQSVRASGGTAIGQGFLRGSSAGLTYEMPHGPLPCNCTTVSSCVHAKCCVFATMIIMSPGPRAMAFDESSLGPRPM